MISLSQLPECTIQNQDEQTPPVQPNDLGNEDELPDLVRRNPGLADRRKVFPTYPWDFDQQSGNRHFQGQVPTNWRRFNSAVQASGRIRWTGFAPSFCIFVTSTGL